MRRKIYTGFSIFQFISLFFLKLIIAIAIPYLVVHFEENRLIISFLILFGGIFILAIGSDQIVVYSDQVVQTTSSFLDWIFRARGTSYQIKDIKYAYLRPEPGTSEIGVAIFLRFLLPSSGKRSTSQPIFFDLHDGRTVQFNTDIEYQKMKKIVDLVNSMVV